jgi:hypothetical protein
MQRQQQRMTVAAGERICRSGAALAALNQFAIDAKCAPPATSDFIAAAQQRYESGGGR